MSEILSNTGVKLWSETDYNELWLTVFDQLTGQGGKSNIRLIDEAIGKINAALDGYKFEFSSDEDRLYISKGDSKLPVSLIDSNGHVASKVDGTTITIDESGVVKGIPVDDALSEESTNPLQNKVIAGELKNIKSKMSTDESTIESNTKRIEANETAISTLNGTGNGSVKKAVSDGIAEVVAGAPEDFDTLKEMSDWISTHETSASAMNSQIQDNKKAIDNHTLNGDVHVTPENKTNWNKVFEKLDKTGDASNVITEFTTATTRSNLTTKEKLSISFGKISKWFSDLKTVAFSGSYNDLSNKPASLPASDVSAWAKASTKPTYTKAEVGLGNVDNTADANKSVKYATSAGSAANATNATKVNNHTVNADVPANAKFTDTTYGVATTSTNGLMSKDMVSKLNGIAEGANKTIVDANLSSTSTNPVQNKVVTSNLTDIRKETTVNLLNPTVQTTTRNGVTCTNNGDGTYTLNGTNTLSGTTSSTIWISIASVTLPNQKAVILGSNNPKVGVYITGETSTMFGDGSIETLESDYGKTVGFGIAIAYKATLDNVVVKPMLTTNLSATYDDFVPYTGDTGKLNGDVAELQDSKADKTEVPKLVKVDGKTVFLSEDGVLSAKGGGATITPKPTVNPQIKNDDKKVVITWEDPTDTVIEGSTFSKWAGTKLVMKESGYPTSPDDGTVLVDNTTRDKYKNTGFEKSGLTNDKVYYFALFPYSTDGVYNYDSGNRLLGEPELKIVTFAGGTDAEIAKMIQAHYNDEINIADYWAVGDTRTVHLSAMEATGVGESHREQDVEFVIGDFEHDDLETPINGHSKAAVTLLQKDCLMDASNASNPVNGSGNTEKGYMNSSATNAGGWKNCARRAWCNNVFFAALPSTWQSMVKIVNKKSGTGGGSSSGTEITADKIFLAAEIEIFGSRTHSVDGEGTQYQYYKNATANRYKMPKWSSSYVSNIYWERSPFSGNANYFCFVYNSGNADYSTASSARGVAPCLCI